MGTFVSADASGLTTGTIVIFLAAALALLTVAGYAFGRLTSRAVVSGDVSRLHSLPSYHGAYVASWVGIPSLLFVLFWLAAQGPLLDRMIMGTLPEGRLDGLDQGQIDLVLAQIKSLAGGTAFQEPTPEIAAAAERLVGWRWIARWSMVAAALSIAIFGLVISRRKISEAFRARQGVERVMDGAMIVCATLAILVTIGIVLSLVGESLRFFARVPVSEFLFGLSWEPQIPIREGQIAASGAFGAVPVFVGTLVIAFLAMIVAVPIGLFSAIYLAEYAGPRFRGVVKPIMEVLAGVPTVVYGFFAALTVAPALRDLGALVGLDVAPNSALAAGAVMGIMITPFVSSFSDDAIRAVPQAMRDGSLGLGATKGETITKVLLPAALPGISGGILLGVSRAIGETMIVVMAAGIIATLTLNPTQPVTTVTVQIVTLLIGDTSFDNPKTLSAFALGLVLFLVTLTLNVIALRIVQKYREQYD